MVEQQYRPLTVDEIEAGAEKHNLRLIGYHDLAGYGDGFRIDKKGDYLFVAHLNRKAFSVLNVANPRQPVLVYQEPVPPNTHSHKVQIAGDLLIINNEQVGRSGPFEPGIRLFDIRDPAAPRQVGFFRTGGRGVHRFWFADGRYAYLPTEMEGYTWRILLIVDVSDPTQPVEVGRWWVPGMWAAGGEQPTWPPGDQVGVHGLIVDGDRAYVGLWDGGWAILDVSDKRRPRTISQLNWHPPYGGQTHTVLPLRRRGLVVVTDESTADYCQEGQKLIWVVDVRDETRPVPIATCPVPEGDYCTRGGHFGPHNVHENRPGSYQDDILIYATYWNAGLRIYDLSNPYRPEEVAYYVPPPPPRQPGGVFKPTVQINDVYVDSAGLIYCTDRFNGGLYILEYTGPRPTPAAPA
ncbi:MAG TPA: hypothetical protein VFB73_05225 [Chloroflexota bacterium]|jgi:hypothetical protein|nr:hypothetical protein [Chloroflexota bacterium]HZU05352.1 hypothetical protein [Chloroflexota bacterium]